MPNGLYDYQKQFEVVVELDSQAEARRATLTMWYDRGPPVTFIPPKNKMLEAHGEFKAKILFSCYRHPPRYYGRLVGRCLSLLLNTWKALVPGIEMSNTTC